METLQNNLLKEIRNAWVNESDSKFKTVAAKVCTRISLQFAVDELKDVMKNPAYLMYKISALEKQIQELQ